MAYRRISRSATFKEEFQHSSPASSSPICHFRTKTLISSRSFSISTSASKGLNGFDDLRNDSKGFWEVLARKAKTILEDDDNLSHHADVGLDTSTTSQHKQEANEGHRRMENLLEHKMRPKFCASFNLNHTVALIESNKVGMATVAKAKLLLRKLKTVKADLAFSKERCDQLEEENKILRESREKGDNHADDDLIRVQLESLLAEKARLAKENSIYARENRFLREIVEYHQLSMQDVVYFDEGAEEVSPCITSTKEATLLHDIPSTIQQHEEAKDASNSEETYPNVPQPSPHNARETHDATTLPPHSSLQI